MKRMALIIIVFFLMVNSAQAEYRFAEKWSWTDTAYQVTDLALFGIDWAQTRTMAKKNWYLDGNNPYEGSPFMSKRPDTTEVDLKIAIGVVSHTLISLALPPEANIFGYKVNPRRIWQCLWIGIEAGAIAYNYAGGVRIEF